MIAQTLVLLGGVGLFILGMQTMTGALRLLGSRRMRAILARFTTTPLAGVVTGAVTTALVQSSSATVMTVIGFVGAGLMTFTQAVGVIFGANIGTTVTGWMVAILGLRLDLGEIALPLVFAGAMAAALGRGRLAETGRAVSGFALIFLGLGLMKTASDTLGPVIGEFLVSGGTIWGRLALVLIGAAFTAIVQSSSAGVATALVLLSGGRIDIVQAAALVIGMDLGTTLKSVLATLGGSRDARRTAYAHVGYNVVTALFAFVLLGLVPYLQTLTGDPATALTAFHTLFNAGGVVIMLPVLPLFARAIERLVPGTAGDMPEPLDTALLTEPRAALDAARAATDRIAAAMFRDLAARLRGAPADGADAEPALEDVDRFLAALAIPEGTPGPRNRMAALLHRLDHLHRLGNRGGQDDRIALLAHDGLLRRPAAALAAALARAAQTPSDAALARRIDRLNGLIAARTARLRRSFLLREHAGLAAPRDVFDLTDALRWLERSGRHAERIVHYGAVAAEEEPSRADARREDV